MDNDGFSLDVGNEIFSLDLKYENDIAIYMKTVIYKM